MEKTKIRFLKKVKINPETGCWEWTATTDGRYGIFHYPGFYKGYRMAKAHHVSMFLFRNIEIEDGLEALHSCDNTICCNPEHLSVGTHQDNMIDMVKKARNRTGREKLAPEEIVEARRLRSEGWQVKDIALKFNLHSSQMSRVVTGCLPKGTRPSLMRHRRKYECSYLW